MNKLACAYVHTFRVKCPIEDYTTDNHSTTASDTSSPNTW